MNETERAHTLAMVESQLSVDRSNDPFSYPLCQRLKRIRDFLRSDGFPREWDQKLRLSLIPFIKDAAKERGLDWTQQLSSMGPLAELFEIDARVMNGGKGRAALSAEEFARYVDDSLKLFSEHISIRASMHNVEP